MHVYQWWGYSPSVIVTRVHFWSFSRCHVWIKVWFNFWLGKRSSSQKVLKYKINIFLRTPPWNGQAASFGACLSSDIFYDFLWGRHLTKSDTKNWPLPFFSHFLWLSIRRTPRAGPCHSSVIFFHSLQGGNLPKSDNKGWELLFFSHFRWLSRTRTPLEDKPLGSLALSFHFPCLCKRKRTSL